MSDNDDGPNALFNPEVATYYVRSGDGKMYREVPNGDGSCDYAEADPAQSYHALADGRFIAMKDTAEAMRQREGSSHMRMFKSLVRNPDPKVAKRAIKTQDALKKQLDQLVIDRVMPHAGPNVMIVKDEKFDELSASYRLAFAAGKQRECDFQPLTTYANKLITGSGKVIRQLYAGEVGMMGDVVVCLEPGYGTGQQVSVLSAIGTDKED